MPSSPFLPHWQNLSWKIMLSFFCLQYFKNRNSLKKTKILTNLLNCEIVFFWRDIAFRQRKVLNHLSKFSLSWILLFETFQFECFFNSNLFSWIYWLAHSWNPEIECLKSAQSCQKLSYELRHCLVSPWVVFVTWICYCCSIISSCPLPNKTKLKISHLVEPFALN